MGWAPSPSYLMRRDRILKQLVPGSRNAILEVGCGAGVLLHELSARGHCCTALETSDSALRIARYVNEAQGTTIAEQPDEAWVDRFDFVLAFEVLEHIEDDRAALMQWRNWLRPGGILLLSVPAKMKKWTASDVWAGHFRRYEIEGLKQLVHQCGFEVEHVEAYGGGLGTLIDPVRARVHARQLLRRKQEGMDDVQSHTALSGVERTLENRMYPCLCSRPGQLLMRLAFLVQAMLGRFGVGQGYLLKARRPATEHAGSSDGALRCEGGRT